MKRGVLFVVASLAPAVGAAAEPLELSVAPSARTVREGDLLTVTVRAVAQVEGPIQLEVPAIEGLTELSRSPYESTSLSIINGRRSMTREQSVQLEYSVDRGGEFEFPAVTARLGPHVARTQPFTFRAAPRPASTTVPDGPPPPGQVAPPDDGERDLFLRYRASKNRVFVGEQVIVDLVLYARSDVPSIEQVPDPPEPSGVWREIIDQPRRLTRTYERIEGQRYAAFRVWRVALFPLEATDIALPPVPAVIRVGGGFSRTQRIRRFTGARTIEVAPVPEDRPAGFRAGNVGQLRLFASTDGQEIDASQGVLLTLGLEGRGNVRGIELPTVDDVPGFRVFPPNVSESVDTSQGDVRGRKVAEILLTPTTTGVVEIPSFEAWTFDPEQEAFVRQETRPFVIKVRGRVARRPDVPPDSSMAPPAKPALTWRPVRPAPRLAPPRPPWRRPWFAAGLAAPWLLLGGLTVARQWQTSRRGRLCFDASTHRSEVLRALGSGRPEHAWMALGGAIRAAVAARFGEGASRGSPEEIVGLLAGTGLPEGSVEDVKRALQASDFARYARELVPGLPPDADRRFAAILDEVAP